MTALTKFLVSITLLFMTHAIAQDFHGSATYKSHRKFDLKMDDKEKDTEMHKQIQEQLRMQFQQEYTLTFTKDESIYKKNEKLNKPNPMANSGVIVTVSEGSDVYYKNIKEGRYTNQSESFGKLFLIKDKLEKRDWQLGSETKNIGEYTCFKATHTEEIEEQTLNEEGEHVKEKKDRTVTAWYTPQIPINNGPQNFSGLPGLILEINDGKLTLVCTKIVMNPKEKVSINEPSKGKKVNQAEFDDIMDKKSKEMMERFRSSHGDGESRTIKIRG